MKKNLTQVIIVGFLFLGLATIGSKANAQSFISNPESSSLTASGTSGFFITNQDLIMDKVNISMDCKTTQPVRLNLYDMAGKKIRSVSINSLKGGNTLSFDISHLSHGLFLFEVISNDEVYKTKIIK